MIALHAMWGVALERIRDPFNADQSVITSYSIHYTKLYEVALRRTGKRTPLQTGILIAVWIIAWMGAWVFGYELDTQVRLVLFGNRIPFRPTWFV